MKRLLLAASALLLTTAIATAHPVTMTVPIHALNNSGESGTAVLTQLPGGVRVVIDLSGAPGTPQPAHIHTGTCDKLNPAPAILLETLVNGESTTVLKGKKISDLTGGKYAINVHASADHLETYDACGAIK